MLSARPAALTLRAHGHPSIRATHGKTAELTAEPELSARATCVVAAVAAADLARLTGLSGAITVTLRAGALHDRITGMANPRFAGGARAVIRRSDHRSPETLVTRADKAAADLDRDLIRALADPRTRAEVVVELGVAPPRRTAELLLCPWRVTAALTGAGMPTGDDAPAAGWAAALRSASLVAGVGPGSEPATALARATGQPVVTGAGMIGPVRSALQQGAIVAVVCELSPAPDDVATFADERAVDGWAVRAIGVPPVTAALVAAGLTGAPFASCGSPARTGAARRRQIAALARAGVVGAWTGRPDTLADLLADVAAAGEAMSAGLSVDVDQPDERHERATAAELSTIARGLRGGHHAVAVVDLRHDGAPTMPDLAVPDLLRALVEAGVAPSTLARGLARLPGVTRRQAYDLMLVLARERPDGEVTGDAGDRPPPHASGS